MVIIRIICKMRGYILPMLLLLLTSPGNGHLSAQTHIWQKIDVGLEIGEWTDSHPPASDHTKIIIIRINPHYYSFKLLSAKELHIPAMTAKNWCVQYGLIGGVNAGMFQQNFVSHVGYMKNYNHINSARINTQYLSVFACNPVNPGDTPARIFDIDSYKMETIIARYNTVIQNLRLIKKPAQNVWPNQSKKWSEVALGEDKQGNILFIFCRTPYSMHDFNEMLLRLPIGIVCAQHLEGGPSASLYFGHNGVTIDESGSFEILFNNHKPLDPGVSTVNIQNDSALPLPNMLGIVKK